MREKKVLLITGASSEVGCSLIRDVADRYELVLAHYCRHKEELEKIKRELGEKLVLLQADFSDLDDVSRFVGDVEAMSYVPDHIVHLPAQVTRPQKFPKTEMEEYVDGFCVSVASIVLILKRFLPKMGKQKYGKVLFMLTSCTLDTPPKYQTPYVTTKYALLGLMRALSREYSDKGVMVNGVSPDMMETKFVSSLPELVVQQNAANSPLGRNLTVEDVVPAFVYLLSDGADTVTGQNLGVTGGI